MQPMTQRLILLWCLSTGARPEGEAGGGLAGTGPGCDGVLGAGSDGVPARHAAPQQRGGCAQGAQRWGTSGLTGSPAGVPGLV